MEKKKEFPNLHCIIPGGGRNQASNQQRKFSEHRMELDTDNIQMQSLTDRHRSLTGRVTIAEDQGLPIRDKPSAAGSSSIFTQGVSALFELQSETIVGIDNDLQARQLLILAGQSLDEANQQILATKTEVEQFLKEMKMNVAMAHEAYKVFGNVMTNYNKSILGSQKLLDNVKLRSENMKDGMAMLNRKIKNLPSFAYENAKTDSCMDIPSTSRGKATGSSCSSKPSSSSGSSARAVQGSKRDSAKTMREKKERCRVRITPDEKCPYMAKNFPALKAHYRETHFCDGFKCPYVKECKVRINFWKSSSYKRHIQSSHKYMKKKEAKRFTLIHKRPDA